MLKSISKDIIFSCFLLIASLSLTHLGAQVMDITLHDESYYLYSGVKLIKNGLPPADWAPLYAVWYYFLFLLEKNNIKLYYLNYKILIVLTTLMLYIFMRLIRITPLVSIIASFLYLLSPLHILCSGSLATHFALLILLFFLLPTIFVKKEGWYYLLLCLGFMVISFIRPEYFISSIFIFAYFFILRPLILRVPNHKPEIYKIFFLLLILLILNYIFGNPLFGHRAWYAFGQHFSANFASWNNIPNSISRNWELVTRSVFGGAHNIFAALINNNKEFVRHVCYNMPVYVYQLGMLLLGLYFGIFSPLVNNLIRWFGFLFLLTVIGYYFFKRRPEAIRLAKDTLTKRLIIIFSAISITVFISALIIYPELNYLFIQVVMLLLLLAYFISNTIENNIKIRKIEIWKSLLLAMSIFSLSLNILIEWNFIQRKAAMWKWTKGQIQPNLKTIRFIESLNISQEVNVLAVDRAYTFYLNDNYKFIDPESKKEDFNRFILRNKINMIIFDEDLEDDFRFINDDEFKIFLNNPHVLDFSEVAIPNTRRYLFVKEKLLEFQKFSIVR